MKKISIILILMTILKVISAQPTALDGNNINAWILNTGIFDIDLRTVNTPGFEWPKGAGTFAIFSAGLTIAAYVNNELLMSSASYKGEYSPGYVVLFNGLPHAQTDPRFHIYKVKRGDNAGNNPDWLNWGLMVPFGAPYTDVNHDGIYEPFIDTPGVKNAAQTIFLCITDGFVSQHSPGEGFGGGTMPMFNEVHLTAWCYDTLFLKDVQFLKWNVINKNIYAWNKTYFSMFCDSDLGCSDDDYIGSDSTRGLEFSYNGHDSDCAGQYRYRGVVPSVGLLWLKCSPQNSLGLSSCAFVGAAAISPFCESDPNPAGVQNAYNFMKGTKKDGTPWVIPPGGQQNITKYVYSGDPESGSGWNEGLPGNIHGCIQNCGGPTIYTGQYVPVNPPGDRRMLLSSGSDNLNINPGDTHQVMLAQIMAKGTSRLNSVTKLKHLSDSVKAFACGGFLIGLEQISSNVPNEFFLLQNYPNPFNPTANIKYQIAKSGFVKLIIYDVTGREVQTLVNEKQNAGTYEIDFDGSSYSSGVYFYKLESENFSETKRMMLLK